MNNVGVAAASAKGAAARSAPAVAPRSEVGLAKPCELITLAPRAALVMRFRSPAAELPRGFFHRYEAMTRYLSARGQKPLSVPFAIYDNVDANAADVEAGFVVAPELASSGDMLVKQLPGVTVAALTHVGDYSGIEPSYFKLLEWVHELGMVRSGRFMECYTNNPLQTPSEALRTQVMVPVGPRSANDP